mgnify:CR=1 FL=1
MKIQWHIAMGSIAASLWYYKTRRHSGLPTFLIANTMIDVDHFPAYAMREGILNPKHFLELGTTGRISSGSKEGLTINQIGHIPRPFHNVAFMLILTVGAMLIRQLRPIAAAVWFHRTCDLIDETVLRNWQNAVQRTADSTRSSQD